MSFAPIWDSLKPLEYFYGANIDALSEVDGGASSDQLRFRSELVRFCVARPRLVRLIDSPYFSRKYAGNPVYDLVIAGCGYGAGQLEKAETAVLRQAPGAADSFFPLLLARVYCAMGDTVREAAALEDAFRRFPLDPLTILSKAEHALVQGNIDQANVFLDQARPAVEAFLSDEIASVAAAAEDLNAAIRDRVLSRNNRFDVYDDALTRATWLGYYEHFTTQNRYQSGDGFLVDRLDTVLTEFIREEGIGALLDFGSLCAEIIARPARRCPATRFVGIDRQPFVATMNREAYDLPNMAFESGDVTEYLPRFAQMPGRKVFFHVRTTCFLYPDMVKKIYSAARSAGVEYIMFWEGDGLSRHLLEFFDFDGMPEITVARKGVLFNHNYKAILDACGYDIVRFNRLPSLSIDKDIGDLVGSAILVVARLRP